MHFLTQNRDAHGMLVRTFHAWLDLPENPVCWLAGHRPRVRVHDGQFTTLVEKRCVVCDRRYVDPPLPSRLALVAAERHGLTVQEFERQHAERAADVARRDPRMVESGLERRGPHWVKRTLELGLEAVLTQPRPEFSLRFHVGSRGSETPLDAHVTVAGSGVYASVGGIGNRLADMLTRGRGRDLALSLHDGRVWWRLWVSGDYCNGPGHSHRQGGRFRPWRCRLGNAPAHPLDYLHGGQPAYSRVDLDGPRETVVTTDDGASHLVRFILQEEVLRRPRGPALRRERIAAWSCDSGIPVGGHAWKCNETSGSTVALPDVDPADPEGWLRAARVALAESVARTRDRYGWRQAR